MGLQVCISNPVPVFIWPWTTNVHIRNLGETIELQLTLWGPQNSPNIFSGDLIQSLDLKRFCKTPKTQIRMAWSATVAQPALVVIWPQSIQVELKGSIES